MSAENAKLAAKSVHVLTMGPVLGPTFHSLQQHLFWTHCAWQEHKVIYRHSEERLELVNRCGATFFLVAGSALWEGVLLDICKLTAPRTSGRERRANISVRLLVDQVGASIRPSVQRAVNVAVDAAQFAEPARNKYLAHRDLSLMLDASAPQISLGSVDQIEQALQAIGDVLDEVETAHGGTTHYWSASADGAETLVDVLERGLRSP